jgi:hypothetical protein
MELHYFVRINEDLITCMRQWMVFPFLPIPWQKVLQEKLKTGVPVIRAALLLTYVLVNYKRRRKVGFSNKWLQWTVSRDGFGF